MGGVHKFYLDYVSEVQGKLLEAVSLGGVWDTYGIRLPGQSVLAFNFTKCEYRVKHARVYAGLPVSDSDRRFGR